MRRFFKEIFWASYDVFCLIIQISLWQDKTILEGLTDVCDTIVTSVDLISPTWSSWSGGREERSVLSVVWEKILYIASCRVAALGRPGRAGPHWLEINTFSKMPLPWPDRCHYSHHDTTVGLPHSHWRPGGGAGEAGRGRGGCEGWKVSMCWEPGRPYDSPGSSWERVTGQWGSSEIRDVIARITNNADTGGRRQQQGRQLMLPILFLSGHISHGGLGVVSCHCSPTHSSLCLCFPWY